jgi:hypothetical protein
LRDNFSGSARFLVLGDTTPDLALQDAGGQSEIGQKLDSNGTFRCDFVREYFHPFSVVKGRKIVQRIQTNLKVKTIMNRVLRLLLSALAIGMLLAAPAIAQNSAMTAYDLSKEIKVQGTIQKIETDGTSGLVGTHIFVQTAQGVVDAHLGFSSAVAPANVGISEGENVTLIGMMQNLNGSNVMLARVLTTSSRVFVLRSERGIPVRAVPSGSFRTASTLKGAL